MPRALISVTDKSGVVELAKALAAKGYEIVSTGGTLRSLKESGVEAVAVSEVTGFPEVLDGRVKTLHPAIHGGILADRSNPEHTSTLSEHGISGIDLLVVNLYRFEQTVTSPHDLGEAIESIDIGGPAMIRAAAKNFRFCLPVVDPADYERVVDNLPDLQDDLRLEMATKAFSHTAYYDSVIARYLGGLTNSTFDLPTATIGLRKRMDLRYGENPHQRAALFVDPLEGDGLATANASGEFDLSFNNIADADAAFALANELDAPACVIVKHANPCGAAEAATAAQAFFDARDADRTSAYGGIVAFNCTVDREAAEAFVSKGNFFEVIVAPAFDPEALGVVAERGGWATRLRLIESKAGNGNAFEFKTVSGGALIQAKDAETLLDWKLVCGPEADASQMRTLRLAWKCVKHVRSNAIVVATNNRLIGVGAGQMNRVQSVRLALEAAGEAAKGAVLASDAFFPFPDSVETAHEAGISAIVQPGGSKNDDQVISKAAELGISMYLSGRRHFKH